MKDTDGKSCEALDRPIPAKTCHVVLHLICIKVATKPKIIIVKIKTETS